MDTDAVEAPTQGPGSSSAVGLLPELEAYAYLLVVTFLVDYKLYPEVCKLPARPLHAVPLDLSRPMPTAVHSLARIFCQGFEDVIIWLLQAKEVVTAGVKRVADFNRRTLDGLAARLYFYYSLAHEQTNTLADIRRCSSCLLIHKFPQICFGQTTFHTLPHMAFTVLAFSRFQSWWLQSFAGVASDGHSAA